MIHHLSASSVQKYQMCPRSWKFRYLDQVPGTDSVNLVFGAAFHDVVETALVLGEALTPDMWRCAWGNQLTDRTAIDWMGKPPDSYERLGNKMVQASAVQELVREIRPGRDENGDSLVEVYVEMRVPDVAVPIIGYVDVVEEDGVPGDIKTASSPWKPGKAASEIQPLVYLAALKYMGYECPNNLFRHYVFVKTGTGRVQKLETPYSYNRIAWGMEVIQQVWSGIRSSSFPACSPLGWWCSKKWCEYWEHCQT